MMYWFGHIWSVVLLLQCNPEKDLNKYAHAHTHSSNRQKLDFSHRGFVVVLKHCLIPQCIVVSDQLFPSGKWQVGPERLRSSENNVTLYRVSFVFESQFRQKNVRFLVASFFISRRTECQGPSWSQCKSKHDVQSHAHSEHTNNANLPLV